MSERGEVTVKLIIGIAVLMIVIATATSYLFMNFFMRSEDTVVRGEDIGPTYPLGEFIVNLADTRGYQLIQANIVVEVENENVIKELDKREPQIRDRINSILRSQRMQDLEEPGVKALKTQIKEALNNILPDQYVSSVWFTRILVQ